ncbi:MAG: type II toxin-antitoxin system RelE/ParE family toxin [Candidatus Riflebacteria bacterium]|nr:type II toxin-antitoxin system RelE/ParE family toxin [Candidatus Riflebacteria bacterium]
MSKLPTFTVYIFPEAGKQIADLPERIQKQIDKKIVALADNPYPAGFKKLKGPEEFFRVRSGDYRIIYQIEGGLLIVIVVRVGNRKEVYKKTLPLPDVVRKSIPKKKEPEGDSCRERK